MRIKNIFINVLGSTLLLLSWHTHALAQGKIYSDPNYRNQSFKAKDLPFQLPDVVTEAKSVPFYAVILKTYSICSVKESERIRVQKLFPKHKVFYQRYSCNQNVEDDRVYYTNTNNQYDFLAVYAGATLKDAKQFSAKIKKLGRFPGHNIRKMQVIYSIP